MAITICNYTECQNPTGGCNAPKGSFWGAVLSLYERNGYNDSDFYAVVWDDDNQCIRDIEYGTTRSWTYHNHAEVDATPEVLEKARVWWANFDLNVALSIRLGEMTTPTYGKRVRSLTTRGKNVGIEGVVKWMGERRSQYGTWSQGWRIGIDVGAGGKLRYIDQNKAEVINPQAPTQQEIEELAEIAWRHAQTTNFRRG